MDPLYSFDTFQNYSLINSIIQLNDDYKKYYKYNNCKLSNRILLDMCNELQPTWSKQSDIKYEYLDYFNNCYKFEDETYIEFYKRCYNDFKKLKKTNKSIIDKICKFLIYITNIKILMERDMKEDIKRIEIQKKEMEQIEWERQLKLTNLKCLKDIFGKDICSIVLKY